MNDLPLLVEFVAGTTLYREPETVPKLPIVQNGPPGPPWACPVLAYGTGDLRSTRPRGEEEDHRRHKSLPSAAEKNSRSQVSA